MSELGYETPTATIHYRPPRRCAPGLLAIAVAGALVLAVTIAYAYILLFFEIRNIYLRVGLLAAGAGGVAALCAGAMRVGRVTSQAIAAVLSCLIALLALYACWVFWTQRVLELFGAAASLWDLVRHPRTIIEFARFANHTGVWSHDGNTMKGLPLLIVWLVEAGAFTIAPVAVGIWAAGSGKLTCLGCGAPLAWSTSRMPRFAADRADEIVAAVEDADFDRLLDQDPLAHEDDPQIDFELQECPSCRQCNVLTVKRVAWVVDENGVGRVMSKVLVDRLMLSEERAAEVRGLRAKLETAWATRAGADDGTDSADGDLT